MRAPTLALGVTLALSSACATERASLPSDDGPAASAEPPKQQPRAKPKPKPKPQPKPKALSKPKPIAPPVQEAEPTVPQQQETVTTREADLQEGVISWYHDSLAGRRTASGERYDPRARTCAHRKHKFGTRLKVTLADTGASVECRVNDRGPFVDGRVLDVSRALAEELGLIQRGVAPGVVVRLVDEAS